MKPQFLREKSRVWCSLKEKEEDLLSSESKSCRSDGRGQIEALDDFLPLFLIDDFDEAASKSD